MTDALLLVATGVLAALGFAMIAVSQKQHRRRVRPSGARVSPNAFRLAGSLLIGLAVFPAVLGDGLAFGLLLWATMLTVAALVVVAGLAKLRRHEGHQGESE